MKKLSCFVELSVEYLPLITNFHRNTNQDGLENFFSVIKANCQNPKQPIPVHFRSAFITSILNTFTCTNSLKTNCERDSSNSLLYNFHDFILSKKPNPNSQVPSKQYVSHPKHELADIITFDPILPHLNCIENDELTHVSSLICCDMIKDIDCESCLNDIQTSSKINSNDLFALDANGLNYPSKIFILNIKKLLCGIDALLPDLCAHQKLKRIIVASIKNISLDSMGCKKHQKSIKQKLINSTTHYSIIKFCKVINDLLSKKTTTLPNYCKNVQIFEVALAFRQKNKRGKYAGEDV